MAETSYYKDGADDWHPEQFEPMPFGGSYDILASHDFGGVDQAFLARFGKAAPYKDEPSIFRLTSVDDADGLPGWRRHIPEWPTGADDPCYYYRPWSVQRGLAFHQWDFGQLLVFRSHFYLTGHRQHDGKFDRFDGGLGIRGRSERAWIYPEDPGFPFWKGPNQKWQGNRDFNDFAIRQGSKDGFGFNILTGLRDNRYRGIRGFATDARSQNSEKGLYGFSHTWPGSLVLEPEIRIGEWNVIDALIETGKDKDQAVYKTYLNGKQISQSPPVNPCLIKQNDIRSMKTASWSVRNMDGGNPNNKEKYSPRQAYDILGGGYFIVVRR